MQKYEARKLVIDTFIHAFDEERLFRFVRNLLPDLEPASTRLITNAQLPQGFREHVNSYIRLGTYRDPKGGVLDVVIVKLKRKESLDRARTRQRNLMAHYLNRRGKDAVLAAYITDDPSDWRFSYVKLAYKTEMTDDGKVKVKRKFTPARRFSFLVGENEPNHTAQKQLGDLLMKKGKLTLDQIEEAFNIESITKEFFEDYKSLFLMIKENLDQIVEIKPKVKEEFIRCEIDTANYAKKLLGQIVFLYFLQKKGWLGVAKDQAWGTGDKKFLSNLFEKNKDKNFFDEILEPFFYEALAMERKGDFYPALQCKLPFLNGGLFEPLNGYDWENTSIGLDNNDFGEVFRVFNLYNFTVREDEPLEKEVAVDPEMLGKVFENLLEVKDRKSKGAYYTPREIVHYMCQESLIIYLDSALNQGKRKLIKEDGIKSDLFRKLPDNQMVMKEKVYQDVVPLSDIETFIRKGEISIERDQAREEGKLGDDDYGLPKSVREHAKEIDFALGDVKICDPAIGSGAFPVGIMTEIVRARRVLTPYISTQRIRDSYSFKWHCIENCLYGVDIDASAIEIAKLRLWLSLVVDEESYDQIRPLPNLDYRIVYGNSLLNVEKNLFNYTLYPELEKKKIQYFGTTSSRNKEILRNEIEIIIDQLTNGKRNFDFEIFFSEVFSSNQGFDIVIGNPPYISYGLRGAQKMTLVDRKYLVSRYPNSAEYKISMYALFMDKAIQLSKPNGGIQTLIVPDSFLLGRYFSKIRRFILNSCNIIHLSWLPYTVFGATVGFSAIYLFIRNEGNKSSRDLIARQITSTNQISEGSYLSFQYPQSYFLDLKHNRFRLFFNEHSMKLVEKIENGSHELGKFVKFRSGLISKTGQKNIISKESKTNRWKPGIISGGEFTKYAIQPEGYFILYEKTKIKSGYVSVDYFSPKIFMRQTGDTIICAFDSQGLLALNNVHIGNQIRKEIDLKFIVAILNSKVIDWYYRQISLESGRTMAQTDIETVSDLPIKVTDKDFKNIIVELVDNILKITTKRDFLGNSAYQKEYQYLEEQIDKLVYELYDLTEEEIAMVEESVGR